LATLAIGTGPEPPRAALKPRSSTATADCPAAGQGNADVVAPGTCIVAGTSSRNRFGSRAAVDGLADGLADAAADGSVLGRLADGVTARGEDARRMPADRIP
jgi:hypothetical protein